MFVIVHNQSVVLGPMRWNRFRFENTIQEECDVSVTLTDRNDDMQPISVSDDVKILPIQGTPTPEYDSKTQYLHGPFWEFTDSVAIMSYTVENQNIEAARNFHKSEIENQRWVRENSGCKVTINDVEYDFATDRDTRSVLQSLITAGTDVNWKFDRDTWVTLTNGDLQSILNAVITHVQDAFNWEREQMTLLDACETLDDLKGISSGE